VFDSKGRFVRKWGFKGTEDGALNEPDGILIGNDQLVYVSDTVNHRIQVFTPEGEFLRKWGTCGAEDGQFDIPLHLSMDAFGLVYVVDFSNN
jgi:hypothetical protein